MSPFEGRRSDPTLLNEAAYVPFVTGDVLGQVRAFQILPAHLLHLEWSFAGHEATGGANSVREAKREALATSIRLDGAVSVSDVELAQDVPRALGKTFWVLRFRFRTIGSVEGRSRTQGVSEMGADLSGPRQPSQGFVGNGAATRLERRSRLHACDRCLLFSPQG